MDSLFRFHISMRFHNFQKRALYFKNTKYNWRCCSSKSDNDDVNKNLFPGMVLSGEYAIKRLIARARFTASPLFDTQNFADWARAKVKKNYITNPDFKQSVDVRELKRKYSCILRTAADSLSKAKASFEGNKNYEAIVSIEKKMKGFEQALESIHKAIYIETLRRSQIVDIQTETISTTKKLKLSQQFRRKFITDEQYNSLTKLYPKKLMEYKVLKKDLKELIEQTPSYSDYIKNLETQNELYSRLGLKDAILKREKMRKEEGHNRHNAGYDFEDISLEIVTNSLLPALSQRYAIPVENLIVIRNFKIDLSCQERVSNEFDFIVIVKVENENKNENENDELEDKIGIEDL